jgi:hypothetical protein
VTIPSSSSDACHVLGEVESTEEYRAWHGDDVVERVWRWKLLGEQLKYASIARVFGVGSGAHRLEFVDPSVNEVPHGVSCGRSLSRALQDKQRDVPRIRR